VFVVLLPANKGYTACVSRHKFFYNIIALKKSRTEEFLPSPKYVFYC